MDASFFAQRRADLGVTSNASSSQSPSSSSAPSDFFTQRKMDLGMVPDTRKTNVASTKTIEPVQPNVQQPATNNGSLADKVQSFNAPDANGNLRTNYFGGFLNPLNDINRIQNAPLVRTLEHSAGQAMGLQEQDMTPAKSTGSKFVDNIAKIIGGGVGYLTNPAQIEQNVGQTFFNNPIIDNVATKLGNKAQSLLPDAGLALSKNGANITDSILGKSLNNLTKGAVVGGLGSAAYAPTQTLNSGQNPQDIPRNMLEQGLQGAALGGALGAVAPSLGAGIKALIDKHSGTKLGASIEQFAQAASNRNDLNIGQIDKGEGNIVDKYNFINKQTNGTGDNPLQLPEPRSATRAREAQQSSILPTNQTPIYGKGDIATLALPESNTPRIINDIKQQSNEIMKPPTSRRDLIDYVGQHMNIDRQEVVKLNDKELYQVGQLVRSGADMEALHTKLAAEQGHNWNDLVSGKSVTGQVEQPLNKIQFRKPTKPTTGADRLSDIKPVTVNPKKIGKLNATAQPKLSDLKANVTEPIKANESGVFGSLKDSKLVSPRTIEAIHNQGETTYTPKTNEETLQNANDYLSKNGINESRQKVMEKDKALSDDETAVAFKLLKHYQDKGDFESAATIAHKLMTSGTANGRAVQINAIFNKMTPEGAAKFAAKLIDKATNGEKNITADQTQRITQFAKQFQTAAGNTELSQSAIRAINKLSKGEQLTVQEADQLKNFAKYAAKNAPKPLDGNYKDLKGTPTAPSKLSEAKPTKLRDSVVSLTSKQADLARERIKARGSSLNSLPLDVWADKAIIGADYIAKGVKTLADFTEKMTDELGQHTYAAMNRIFVDSFAKYRQQNKIKMTDFEKIVNRAIDTHGIGNNEANAIKAKAIELIQMSGKDKVAAEARLHQQFQELTDPTFGTKLSSLLRSAQLLNPRTTLRNVISNMMFYSLDTSVRKLSSIVDLGASTLTGKDRQIFWKSAPNIWKNFFGDVAYGGKEGFAGRNPGGFATQFDLGNNAFNRNGGWGEKVGSFLERSLGAVNKSMDYASANMAMKNELYQLSKAKAYAEGHRGAALESKAIEEMHLANEEMLAQAHDYGNYMTFQDTNFLSTAAQNLKMKVLNAGKEFGLGNILLNYPKTPANILMRAIDYSPAGYLKFAGNLFRMANNPKIDKKTLIQDFMRASGGTSLLFASYQLAKAGLVNVLPSQDPQVNSLERSAGIVANSVNVDGLIRYAKTMFSDPSVAKKRIGDYYASMDWAQPMAMSAAAGASIAQANDPSRMQKGINAGSAAEQSLEGSLESVGNMSVLSNIKKAIMGNTSNPNQTILGRTGDIIKQIPPAFVPSVLGQLKNTIDPAVRDTYQGNFMQQLLNQVVNKLPGLSKTLPQRIDTLGEPMKNQFGVSARAANAFLNPSLMGRYEPNQAAQVIIKMINSSGDQGLAPASPQKSLNIEGLRTKLTTQEYQDLQTSKGKQIQDLINQNMDTFNDPKMTDSDKVAVLKALLSASSAITNGNLKAQKIK